MAKRITRCGWLVALWVLMAPSVHAAAGTNLRWIDCLGDGGLLNRYFACNTNAGFESLVGSFEVGMDMPEVTGLEIVVDLNSAATPLPSWWQFKNVGTCRTTSLSFSTTPPATASTCQDWSNTQAIGGIGAYNIGIRGPNTARVIAAVAVPPTAIAALVTGQEYFGFQLRIQHAKTVGASACEGCCSPAGIVFNAIKVATPVAQDDRIYSGPTNGTDSNFALWQGGFGLYALYPPGPRPPCGATVPTRSHTWSQLKALYR